MNRYEKKEIQNLPSEYRPLGAWSYFGYHFLFSLPIIGFIILIVCAFSNSNINRRSYARSFFCALLIDIVLTVVLIILLYPYIQQWIAEIERALEEMAQQYPIE